VRLAAVIVVGVALVLPAVAWAIGELTQKGGTAGCISQDGTSGTCQDGTALDEAQTVAVSADGKNVYVASAASGAVLVC
jgi:DNA-binding beta-propeller fold protein YncE